MKTSDQLKQLVKEKYGQIAEQDKAVNAASCCGAGDASKEVYNIMTDDYSELQGYDTDADLGLGCGLPTQFANIRQGDTVVDLGSGAGNDCFVARHETGPEGKVIGIDFTPAMINKARKNAEKLGFNNVEFREGDIEQMPLNDGSVDVIVSNCVLNLVPGKKAVFTEMHRVLKPTGHFSISDIVLQGQLPEGLKEQAEMYAGCVSGAIQKNEYMRLIKEAGFENIRIQKEKVIRIPDDILQRYLSAENFTAYKQADTGIFSITVYAEKSAAAKKGLLLQNADSEKACCGPDCC